MVPQKRQIGILSNWISQWLYFETEIKEHRGKYAQSAQQSTAIINNNHLMHATMQQITVNCKL